MDHPVLMGFLQALADLDPVLQHLFGREWSLGEAVGQGLAFEVFHDQEIGPVLVADVMQRADVGVIQRRNSAGFALEALPGIKIGGKMRRQDLDRDGAIQARVPGAIHLAHAASAQRRLNFIGPEFRPGGKCHQCAPL